MITQEWSDVKNEIRDKLLDRLEIHITWSGRHGADLKAEYDHYRNLKRTFKYKDIHEASTNDTVLSRTEIELVQAYCHKIKGALYETVVAIDSRYCPNERRDQMDRIPAEVYDRAIDSFTEQSKEACVFMAPDFWVPVK